MVANNAKKILIFILSTLSFAICSSQNNFTIHGYVKDFHTGEYLINATVFDSLSNNGIITNNYGFYSLSFAKNDSVILIASYLGYKPEYKKIHISADTTINFTLKKSLDIAKVVISAKEPTYLQTQMSRAKLSSMQIEAVPAIAGETDILKSYQLMPGIQQGSEGSSDFFVRGGSQDQNLILLDDVPLYYVNHLGGFVSVFNNDIIKSSELIKGSFPARYGNRLSSVLDVRMNDGNNNLIKGSGTIGMMTTKLALEGPVKDSLSSFMISARRFMWDLLFMYPVSIILSDGKNGFGYTFYDINAKISRKISPKDRIYGSFYFGNHSHPKV